MSRRSITGGYPASMLHISMEENQHLQPEPSRISALRSKNRLMDSTPSYHEAGYTLRIALLNGFSASSGS